MKRDVQRASTARRSAWSVWTLSLVLLALAGCESPVTSPVAQPQLESEANPVQHVAGLVAIEDALHRIVPALPPGDEAAALRAWLGIIRSQQNSAAGRVPSHVFAQTRQTIERARRQTGESYWPDLDAIELAILATETSR